MSFIYAMNDLIFSILSDTKIDLDDDLEKFWESENDRRLVKQIGLMKSIIVSPNLVICYAGNKISKAAELLRKVKCMPLDMEEIVDLAFNIHINSGEDEIEFLIAYCDQIRELVSIKNHQVIRKCKSAWLGSLDAYIEFTRLLAQINPKEEKAYGRTVEGAYFEEVIEKELMKAYEIERCFSKVVGSGVVSSVGGMTVKIRAMEGEDIFQYMAGMEVISSDWPQLVRPGEYINFFEGAGKGSYSCNIYQSGQNFCCYIYEGNYGVVYTDEVSYCEALEGMKFPKLYKIDKSLFDDIAKQNGAYPCIDFA